MKVLVRVCAVLLTISCASSRGADSKPKATADSWAGVIFLVGAWQGTTEGPAGQGSVSREYRLVLGDHFIRETSATAYSAQGDEPASTTEQWSYLSFDRGRNRFVIRQFRGEGYIFEFVLDPTQSTGKKRVFESERLENFRNKWHARLTLEPKGSDQFIETFEFAPPDSHYELYSRTRLKRTSKVH
jgi:hypothetical protein